MREMAARMLRPGCCARSREPGALAEAWEAARLRGCAAARKEGCTSLPRCTPPSGTSILWRPRKRPMFTAPESDLGVAQIDLLKPVPLAVNTPSGPFA